MSTIITDGRKLQGSAMPKIVEGFQREVVGRLIIAAGYHQEEPGGAVYPAIQLDNGYLILGQCDDEGNGPGVLVCDGECLCQTEKANAPKPAAKTAAKEEKAKVQAKVATVPVTALKPSWKKAPDAPPAAPVAPPAGPPDLGSLFDEGGEDGGTQ